jgi:hypothetical protein
VPGCTAASISVPLATVTVVNESAAAVAGVQVQYEDAANPGTWNNFPAVTNASGQAVRALATANYRFRVTYNTQIFYSGAAGSCAVPGCTAATITVNRPITVTLLNDQGAAISGVQVQYEDAAALGTWTNFGAVTNASGQTSRSLATANYRFRVTYGNQIYYSGAAGSCAVPGCTSATITANRMITVTLTSTSASAANINNKQVFSSPDGVTWTLMPGGNTAASGIKNNAGLATAAIYYFRVTVGGVWYYSGGAPNCDYPANCVTAAITVP